jgi:hypothetical protein
VRIRCRARSIRSPASMTTISATSTSLSPASPCACRSMASFKVRPAFSNSRRAFLQAFNASRTRNPRHLSRLGDDLSQLGDGGHLAPVDGNPICSHRAPSDRADCARGCRCWFSLGGWRAADGLVSSLPSLRFASDRSPCSSVLPNSATWSRRTRARCFAIGSALDQRFGALHYPWRTLGSWRSDKTSN